MHPELEIQKIFINLCSDAKRLLKIVTEVIIYNFLSNLSKLTKSDDSDVKSTGKGLYRETSSLITALLSLLQKHRHLAIYLFFLRSDYSSLVKGCQHKTPLLSDMDCTSLRSVTFFECLFLLKYFSIHGQDLILLVKSLGLPTGTLFISRKDPTTRLDISQVMINRILQMMIQELKNNVQKPSKSILEYTEKHRLLYSITSTFSYAWTSIIKLCSRRNFEDHYKDTYFNLLKQIIRSFKILACYNYHVFDGWWKALNILVKQLENHYQTQISLMSTNEKSIGLYKNDRYSDFLPISKTTSLLEYKMISNNTFARIQSKLRDQSRIPTNKNEEFEEKVKNRNEGMINKHKDNVLRVPLNVNSIVSESKSWQKILTDYNRDLDTIISNYYTSENDQKEFKRDREFTRNIKPYTQDFSFDIGIKIEYTDSSLNGPEFTIISDEKTSNSVDEATNPTNNQRYFLKVICMTHF